LRPSTRGLAVLIGGWVLACFDPYRNRAEPQVKAPLDDPPKWMNAKQKVAWNVFRREIPWLNKSHRSLVEIASFLRASVMAGDEMSVNSLNLLRQCLGQMGATPADASKVTLPDSEESNDPSDKYFQ